MVCLFIDYFYRLDKKVRRIHLLQNKADKILPTNTLSPRAGLTDKTNKRKNNKLAWKATNYFIIITKNGQSSNKK